MLNEFGLSAEQVIDDYRNTINKDNHSKCEILKDNGFKIWIPGGLVDNSNFYKYESSPMMLYLLFRGKLIRGKMTTPLWKKIKQEYYDNGYLVCALSYSQIMDKTGWYRSKIHRYVNELVERRWIRIDRVNVGKKYKQNIYLLGRLTEFGTDRYFIDEVVSMP